MNYEFILLLFPFVCNFSTTVSGEIFATSFNPFASNQGAVTQSNPFPNVLSGETMYQ